MTLTQTNDYPTTRSLYLPSNSPAGESLLQGSFIEARKPYQNHVLWPETALRRTGPRPVLDPTANEWAPMPVLRRLELNA